MTTSDFIEKIVYDELVKEVNAIDLNKQNLEQKLKMLIKRYLVPVNLLTLVNSID